MTTNPLTGILPTKVRKYVYAGYALVVACTGVYALFANVPEQVLGIESAIGTALGVVAASNVRHTPPAV